MRTLYLVLLLSVRPLCSTKRAERERGALPVRILLFPFLHRHRLPFQPTLLPEAVSNLKSQILGFDDSHFSAYFFFHSAMAASFSFSLFSKPCSVGR